jgi:hypothetical protein
MATCVVDCDNSDIATRTLNQLASSQLEGNPLDRIRQCQGPSRIPTGGQLIPHAWRTLALRFRAGVKAVEIDSGVEDPLSAAEVSP